MPDWPLPTNLRTSNETEATGTSTVATVTAAGSTNTKGTPAQLIASTPFDAHGLIVTIRQITGTSRYLLDIMTGANTAELVLVGDIHTSNAVSVCSNFYIPIAVAAGTRISARSQADTASLTMRLGISLMQYSLLGPVSFSRSTTYGSNTATSGGTSVDPGGTAHTKGAWAPLSTSTTNDIKSLMLMIGSGNNAAMTSAEVLLDVGIGASGQEKVIIDDLYIRLQGTATNITPAVLGPFLCNIPAGTRLSVRTQCGITDTTDRLIDVVAYGLD